MEHSTVLPRLPEGVVFPPHLGDRVRFDPARGRLSFRGFMAKSTYDELVALARDPDYRNAIDRLFVLSADSAVSGTSRSQARRMRILIAASVLFLLSVTVWAVMHRLPGQRSSGDRNIRGNSSPQETASTR